MYHPRRKPNKATHIVCFVIKLFSNLRPSQTRKRIQDMSTKLCAEVTAEIKPTSKLQFIYTAMNVINGVCSFVAVDMTDRMHQYQAVWTSMIH